MPEESTCSLLDLVKQDKRYPIDAYLFIREALAYASDTMELGTCYDSELQMSADELQQARRERHLSGQQLCDAIRQYATNQFGYMAKVVLNGWGIDRTKCFGDIVYNMISAGFMKKSSHDERGHFDDVYDFNDVFQNNFEICCSPIAQRGS